MTFLAGAILGLVVGLGLGRWRGHVLEAGYWRACAILEHGDHMRSAGKDYKVMLLDTFYRNYHNPLALARMKK